MKTNEHLALFLLGVGTLGITFLLLLAFSDKNTASISAIDKQVQLSSAQATLVPQTLPHMNAQSGAPESPSMETLNREVAETFAKTAEYLGRGRFEEKEHIALLERLEFYSGLSSIRREHKETAQDLIKDMGRLLTLKESVARQVKLAGQISAAETDVQIHLARGERDEAEAQKLIARLEGLYAIHGLSEHQNQQLRTSLAALKKAYRAAATTSSSAKEAKAPEVPKPSLNETVQNVPKSIVQPKAEPAPAPKVAAPAPAPENAAQPASKATVTAPTTEKSAEPVQKASASAPKETSPASKVATEPKKGKQKTAELLSEQIATEYSRVMTYVSRYFVVRKYDQRKHDELTADLNEVAKSSAYLSKDQQERLKEAIAKMKRVEEMMKRDEEKRTRASLR